MFERYNSTVIFYRGVLPTPSGQCIVADAEAAKVVFTNKKDFGKPIEDYGCVFGALPERGYEEADELDGASLAC